MDNIRAEPHDGGIQLQVFEQTYDLIPEAAKELSDVLFKTRAESGPIILGGRQLILGPDTRLIVAEALLDALERLRRDG